MTETKLVVACGAWNEQQYLGETIPAILNQTLPEFKLLLFDNGSRDRTFDLIKDFARHDDRITPWTVPENLSSGDATHLGMALVNWMDCGGLWVVFQGADDIMDVDYLEALWAAKEANPSANYIYSPHRYIGHPEMGVTRHPDYDPANCCGPAVMFPQWSMLLRPLWYELGGFDRKIRIGADWDMFRRASVQGLLRPVQLDEPHLNLRIRTDRPSQSSEVDWGRLQRHLLKHRYNEWAKWE